jgi:hypothetical protein
MQRLPHPDEETEKLIQWLERSDQWKLSQGDAQVKAQCDVCGRREYFHLMAPQIPATMREDEIRKRPCCGGEQIA